MDRQTLSNYGWIIITVLVLAVMLALATPFGTYVGDGVVSVANGFVGAGDTAIDEDNISNLGQKWDNKLNGSNGVGNSGNISGSTPTEPTPEQPTEPETPATFTFLLDGKTYTADEGMTWTQWCNSSYNTNGYLVSGENVKSADGNIVASVLSSDLISANTTYTITEPSEPLPTEQGWADLITASKDGTYATKYRVGDLVTLELANGTSAQFKIVGIDHDNLADGSGKAHLTLMIWQPIGEYIMNSSGVNAGGWAQSDMRAYLQGEFMNEYIPTSALSAIKTVTKTSFDADTQAAQITEDKLWIPSATEVGSDDSLIVNAEGSSSAYSYFNIGTRVEMNTAVGTFAWLRSACPNCGFQFLDENYIICDLPSSPNSIALGFCI